MERIYLSASNIYIKKCKNDYQQALLSKKSNIYIIFVYFYNSYDYMSVFITIFTTESNNFKQCYKQLNICSILYNYFQLLQIIGKTVNLLVDDRDFLYIFYFYMKQLLKSALHLMYYSVPMYYYQKRQLTFLKIAYRYFIFYYKKIL